MPLLLAILLPAAAYLIGSIPFGYLVARTRGIDIFKEGSGNIGATNVGRVLGRKFGVLVFLLDFAKGAVPAALAEPVARLLDPDAVNNLPPDALRVLAGLAAFLGHLFPVYLGLRGGKGVATGAGAMFVLVPGPAAVAGVTWAAVVCASGYVSLGSVAAVIALVAARLLSVPRPFGPESLILTLFCLAGAGLVVVRHRGNLSRLRRGTENRVGAAPMRDTVSKSLHVLALGLWAGSAVFFNFVAAPRIFEEFKQVVANAPSDRTANLPLAPGAGEEQKEQLANALAGSAVGPLFGPFFVLQAVCGVVALVTALGWWTAAGKANRFRVYLLGLALLTVAIGWPISQHVSALRPQRFSPDTAVAEAARDAFAEWHLISLALSIITALLVLVALALAGRMPERPAEASAPKAA